MGQRELARALFPQGHDKNEGRECEGSVFGHIQLCGVKAFQNILICRCVQLAIDAQQCPGNGKCHGFIQSTLSCGSPQGHKQECHQTRKGRSKLDRCRGVIGHQDEIEIYGSGGSHPARMYHKGKDPQEIGRRRQGLWLLSQSLSQRPYRAPQQSTQGHHGTGRTPNHFIREDERPRSLQYHHPDIQESHGLDPHPMFGCSRAAAVQRHENWIQNPYQLSQKDDTPNSKCPSNRCYQCLVLAGEFPIRLATKHADTIGDQSVQHIGQDIGYNQVGWNGRPRFWQLIIHAILSNGKFRGLAIQKRILRFRRRRC